MRKVRKDSKLHGLPKAQRAMVNKWLFDKGLTYQEVSEACLNMFGLKVSKSSVGRYHEREAQSKVRGKKDEGRKGAGAGVSGKVGERVKERKALTAEQMYQQTLRLMTKWALEELKWPVEDERDVKGVLRVMRILISARREKNEADMMKLARERFEIRAAKECMKYWTATKVSEGVGKCVSGRKKGTREQRWPGRGEKDPMMVWAGEACTRS